MQDFWLYFGLGKDHIADLQGYDHILFVAALCLRYLFRDWKKVLILITAFTIGHSITLALSVLNVVNISTAWIEFLIPVTIVFTALSNVWEKKFEFKTKFPLIYFLALFFGLIHGLGFSNYLKSLLGKSSSIAGELLAFNLGLEAGQLLIVAAIMLISWIVVQAMRMQRREWLLFASGGIFCLSLLMAIERFPI
ncbi:HupE/UreJ family protein [Parasegetibacter sp. NRK P23]|uniref:HupE/UreJ family protein n=1 Tax=Parasegetibacter sp. NRK P23 TaxID=2942999 RepID=UPI002043987C|nr:HupE/UreJ family protein [Parasegetibacter sp. NRK P23]MCM5527198.1 HupE/UreJ family protein [Parasegetibacter sp. NRK P23]